MNKYAARALSESAQRGRHILVIVEAAEEAAHTINLFEEHGKGIRRTLRSNGSQRVDFESGGVITIRTRRSQRHRGLIADTVFLDAGIDQTMSSDEYRSLAACVAASPTGELVRA